MKRPLVLTGVALGAVTVLTGCGGKKQATTTARTVPPSGTATRPAPHASVTVRGTVTVGRFCGMAGAVGKTTTGAWARCAKKPGDARARWYAQPGGGAARAGQFCSTTGKTATSPTGAKLVCSKKRGDTRARWHTK